MLDVSLPSLAPRPVADPRPASDAAATARIDRPPLAVGVGTSVAVTSLSQEALVAQSAIEPTDAGAASGAIGATKRVLKPWGVPMLPWDPPPDEPRKDKPADGIARAGRELTGISPDASLGEVPRATITTASAPTEAALTDTAS